MILTLTELLLQSGSTAPPPAPTSSTVTFTQFLLLFSAGVIIFTLVLPSVGALVAYRGLRAANVTDVPSILCVKIFFAATYTAYLALIVLRTLFSRYISPDNIPVLLAAMCLQVVLIVVLLRKPDRRAILVAGAAAVAVDLGAVGLMYLVILMTRT
jgi:hypothetical protein